MHAQAEGHGFLAEKVPLSAAVVLHLGCGDGAVAASLRRRNPTCRLIGIEPDPALAARASAVLDRAYCLAPERDLMPALPQLDCILVSPGACTSQAMLAELGRMLSDEGVLVLCLPQGDLQAQHSMIVGAGLHALDAAEMPPFLVWRLGRGPERRMLRVLSSMLPHVGGVSQVRVVEPMAALMREPAIAAGIAGPLETVPDLAGAPGVFILHRPALVGATGLEVVRILSRRGWVVVCEFDDHPSQIGVLHRSDVVNFSGVHAIQTSTPALAEVFRRENPEVAVFPNALAQLPEPANFTAPEQLTVLFAALNREEDWPGQIEAINAAARQAGGRLRFEVVADQAFFEALDTPHKRFTPLCDYETYLGLLSRCEVSFMPLRDTLFNRCKSDLKFLEAAGHRVVALASPTVYAASIRDGENGLIFADPQGLFARLMWLANNPDKAQGIADQARAGVARERMLAFQMRARTAWYRSLWERREALQAALVERVPGLKEAVLF